jgi:hypothetical protein
MMLRGNLATRPFYNERVVGLLLALVAVIAVALTMFNASRLLQLSSRRSALRAQMAEDEANAARIHTSAVAVQKSVDRAAVSPDFSGDDIIVTMLLVGRTPEDVDRFMDALEETGAFYDVGPTTTSRTEDGLERVTVRGFYLPPKVGAAVAGTAPAPTPTPPASGPPAEAAAAAKPGGGR